MTVTSTAVRSEAYAGDGVTTAFPVPFQFQAAGDLRVIQRDAQTGAETVLVGGYSITGGMGGTGTVTAAAPPPAGVQWVIVRRTPQTQPTEWRDGDRFPAGLVEAGLDRLTMVVQEAADRSTRALYLPDSDPAATTTLPPRETRARKALVFDGAGNVVASADDYNDQAANAAEHAATAQRQVAFAEQQANLAAAQVGLAAGHANAAAQSDAAAAASAALAAANAAVAAGQDAKASVRVGTTVPATLAGEQTIQGVGLVTGDRVLVKAQANTAENGLYVVRSGPWERAPDMDAWAEVPCAFVFVEEGSEADTGWVCTSNPGGTLGTTAVTWARYTVALAVTAPAAPGAAAQVGVAGTAARADHIHTYQEEWVTIAVSDEATPLTVGVNKVAWRAPYAFTMTRPPRASLSVASSGGAVVVNVKETGVTLLGSKVTLDQGARTSASASNQPTIADAAVADDAEVTFDIDAAGSGAKGLKVTLYFRRAS